MDSCVRDLTVGKPSSLIIGFAVPSLFPYLTQIRRFLKWATEPSTLCLYSMLFWLSAMLLQLFGSLTLIFWAYPITWVISTVIFTICYFKSDWIHGFETC